MSSTTVSQLQTAHDHPGNTGVLYAQRQYSAQRPLPLCIITLEHPITHHSFKLSNIPSMSHPQSTASSSSLNFQLIINNALDKYTKRTGNDLLVHPLATQLQSCDSPSAILAVLQQQFQGPDQFRSGDDRWSRWLDPTIHVLYTLSSTVGAGVGLVCLRIEQV